LSARVWVPIVLVLTAVGIALFMFDFPRAPDDQMAPSIRKGDLLFACRVCGAPGRGDVVLFTPPDSSVSLTIRRVVAIPGDSLELRRGALLVNDAPLDRERSGDRKLDVADSDSPRARTFEVWAEINGQHHYDTLKEIGDASAPSGKKEMLSDAYYLLADLRSLSRDSREYGPIPRGQIRSRVLRVLNAADGDGARQAKVP
jgi:signal peptidase I